MVTRMKWFGLFLLLVSVAQGGQPNPPGQVKDGRAVHEAYLFAHIMHGDYGRLYYSASLDGLHWRSLNQGRRVFEDYRGHPDICQGHDGRYYLVGNRNDSAPDINFWVSDDLVTWTRYGDVTPNLKATPGYERALQRIGAPKLFYDQAGSQYVLTWHTPHEEGTKEDPERYWASQRTLYLTSKDLKAFSDPPRRLFLWDMGTIDVIIRKQGDRYFALIKDERYPTLDWVTGKTIRISEAPGPFGPWTEPSAPISPNFREAPTLIPSPDGKAWYLYYEQYPGVSYGLSVSADLRGPWYQVSGYTFHDDWDKYSLPPKVRHGCMLAITRSQYDGLVSAFGLGPRQDRDHASQFPSPMRDAIRAHERIEDKAVPGVSIVLDRALSKPVEVYWADPRREVRRADLLIHFHGASHVPKHAGYECGSPLIVAVVNLGSGSAVYENEFSAESTFPGLIEMIRKSVSERASAEIEISGVYLSSFSAGYGAVRAILRSHSSMLDGIVLLDGLHTDYVPSGRVLSQGGTLNTEKLQGFLEYAKLAAAGERHLVITHSEIFPGTYASTTETADYLIDSLHLQRQSVLQWGPGGMQMVSETHQGGLAILGFAGNTAPDHVDHFHALPAFLKMILDKRSSHDKQKSTSGEDPSHTMGDVLD